MLLTSIVRVVPSDNAIRCGRDAVTVQAAVAFGCPTDPLNVERYCVVISNASALMTTLYL
jgi:hypothetical protein